MHKSDEKYQAYVKILEEELVPAMGCTEPIAYAGAVARKTLGNLPEQLDIKVSGNIIKNVKSVHRSQYWRHEGNCSCSVRGCDRRRCGSAP